MFKKKQLLMCLPKSQAFTENRSSFSWLLSFWRDFFTMYTLLLADVTTITWSWKYRLMLLAVELLMLILLAVWYMDSIELPVAKSLTMSPYEAMMAPSSDIIIMPFWLGILNRSFRYTSTLDLLSIVSFNIKLCD